MKKVMYLLFASLIMFGTACKHNNCCVPPPAQGFIRAMKNGSDWSGNPASSNIVGDMAAVFATNFSNSLEETLTLQFKFTGTGTYSLKDTPSRYYNTIGGDAVTREYQLDDTFDNSITVTSYDAGTNLITGDFNVKLKQSYPAPGNNTDSELQFLNGTFKVVLNK